MQQTKFSLTRSLVDFLGDYQRYGFKDKSAMVRAALTQLQVDFERQSLEQSAELYAELYEVDSDLQELTESALAEWPE